LGNVNTYMETYFVFSLGPKLLEFKKKTTKTKIIGL
jgi:hypothetical protein